MKSVFVCFPFLMASMSNLRAEQPRTDINPALLYYQAFLLTPDFAPADRDYLFNNDWRGQKLTDRFGQLLAKYDNEFKLVRQAAHSTVPCDWGIDMTPGPATLLPGLARNKAVAQAARLRAPWNLQQGRQADARDDLLGAFVLGRNGSRDGTLISMLVQIAVENIVCCTVAENFYLFSPETLKDLADGFDAAPARSTVASCIPTEKAFFHDWMLSRISELQKANPGNEAKVMANIRELFDSMQGPPEGGGEGQTNLWEQIISLSGGTSDGVLKLAREAGSFDDRLASLMALPHPEYEEQLKAFEADLQQSRNPFVSLSLPAIEKCRPKEFAIIVELAMVRAAVDYKLNGQAGLQSVADPCGQGPFQFQRFVFEGVDRGFELKSAYAGRGFQEVLIFVEKDGVPFRVNFKDAGQPLPKASASK